MKQCQRCKERKHLNEFSLNRNYADGLQPDCRICYNRVQADGRRRRNPLIVQRELERQCQPGMKRCTGCKTVKSTSEFESHSTGRDGLRGRCRLCSSGQRKIYSAERHRKNPEIRRNAGALYHKASPRTTLRHAIANALRRCPTIGAVTTDDLMQMWGKQHGRCALSGIQMTWASDKGMPIATSVALDRIDRTRGYERYNVRLLCNAVNNFRGVMSDTEMLAFLEKFYQFQYVAEPSFLPTWLGGVSEAQYLQ